MSVQFAMGPAAPVIALLAVVGARRAPWLFAYAAAIWITHSLIAHKEVRFIAPAFPFIAILAGLGASDRCAALGSRIFVRAAAVLLVCHSVQSVWYMTARPLGATIAGTDILNLQRIISRNAVGQCTLGFPGLPWWLPGATSWVNGRVSLPTPIDATNGSYADAELDFALSEQPLPAPYERLECSGDICLYSRNAACLANND